MRGLWGGGRNSCALVPPSPQPDDAQEHAPGLRWQFIHSLMSFLTVICFTSLPKFITLFSRGSSDFPAHSPSLVRLSCCLPHRPAISPSGSASCFLEIQRYNLCSGWTLFLRQQLGLAPGFSYVLKCPRRASWCSLSSSFPLSQRSQESLSLSNCLLPFMAR